MAYHAKKILALFHVKRRLPVDKSPLSVTQKFPLGLLPRELIFLILSHLDSRTLCTIASVCSLFRDILSEPFFWSVKIATLPLFERSKIPHPSKMLYFNPYFHKKQIQEEVDYFLDNQYQKKNQPMLLNLSEIEAATYDKYRWALAKISHYKDCADKFYQLNNVLEALNTLLSRAQLRLWEPVIDGKAQILAIQGITRLTEAYLSEPKNQQVKGLNLNGTPLTSFPLQPHHMPRLSYLWLRSTKITEVPALLLRQPHASQLKALDIAHTRISSLPEAIGAWCMLKTLDIENLALKTLPKAFAQLVSLQEFYYRANNFIPSLRMPNPEPLPWEIGQMPVFGAQLVEIGIHFALPTARISAP